MIVKILARVYFESISRCERLEAFWQTRCVRHACITDEHRNNREIRFQRCLDFDSHKVCRIVDSSAVASCPA